MADPGLTPTGGASRAVVDLQTGDLAAPGVVFCPNPRMPLWNHHPRVYLDVGHTGEARCAYCGTVYRLAGGAQAVAGH